MLSISHTFANVLHSITQGAVLSRLSQPTPIGNITDMTKLRLLISTVALAFASLAICATTLSLDDCLKIALAESPTIKVADLEIKRVDYTKKNVLADLLPQISFDAQYSRMLAKQVAYMNMDDFKGFGGGGEDTSDDTPTEKSEDTGIKMGLDNSYSLGFTASLPLIAPQLWASMKLSDAQILQTMEQARASRLDLVAKVKAAYYSLLLAKDSQRVIQQSYDMAALTHDIYQKRHSVGDASEYDVLRSSVSMKNIEPQLLQAEITIKQARLQLILLMGVDASFDFDIAGKLSDYEQTMYGDVLSLPSDLSHNTSLIMNDLQQKTLEQTLRVGKMAWYPTLSLSANYNWTSSSDGSPFKNFRWSPYSVVGLNLSIPLFTGGKRLNTIRQAEVQIAQNRLQREDLERSVSIQVTNAVDNIQLGVRQIASCSQSVMQAEKAHTIMQQSFDIGSASYLDLRDSELALTRSQLTYYQSIYDYLVATNKLELLLGTADVTTPDTSSNNEQAQ